MELSASSAGSPSTPGSVDSLVRLSVFLVVFEVAAGLASLVLVPLLRVVEVAVVMLLTVLVERSVTMVTLLNVLVDGEALVLVAEVTVVAVVRPSRSQGLGRSEELSPALSSLATAAAAAPSPPRSEPCQSAARAAA